MKTKDEVFSRFQEFKAPVDNMTGRKIKVLCTDNGGKYTDKAFTGFYAKEGIRREWTTPYNPQKNRVAKWKHMTIDGAARAMLYDQDLPQSLWVEAFSTIVYIQNKVSHKALGMMTFEEAFTGKKPKVGPFTIFGSIAYCHVPDDKHTKLDQTTKKGFFVVYNETSKTYRIYIPSIRKIIVRWDVNFQEEKAFSQFHELPIDD